MTTTHKIATDVGVPDCGHPNHGQPDHDCTPFTRSPRTGPVPLRQLVVDGLEIPVDRIGLGLTHHDVNAGTLTVTFIGVRTVETVYRWMDQP